MRLLLALVVAFLLVQNAAPIALVLRGGLDYDAARHGEVVLLGTAGCSWCARVRAYLRAGGVPYRELDVERDPEGARRFEEAGGIAVPILQVGSVTVRGYDPDAIRAAFAQAAAERTGS
jgi:glutaredoxin